FIPSCTSRAASAATKSAPNSGRSSAASTASTRPEGTTAMRPPISSSRGSMSTATRRLAAATSLAPCSWIWSIVPWTSSDLVLTARSSAPTTSSSSSPAPGTIGQKVITRREPSSSISSSMSFARRPRIVIACKVYDEMASVLYHFLDLFGV
ncbi:unnamed protein product, partial [Linum tenue]